MLTPHRLRRLHLLCDLLLVAAAWIAAYWTREALSPLLKPLNPFNNYIKAFPVIVVPWIVSSWAFGIYQTSRVTTAIDSMQESLKGTFLGLLVISAISFFFREYDFGRSVVLICAGYCLVLQGCSRALFNRAEQRLRRSGLHDVRALVVGAGTTGIRLMQKLQDNPEIGYRVIGFLDDDPGLQGIEVAGRPVLGTLEELGEAVQRDQITEVIIAIPGLDATKLLALAITCSDIGVAYHMVTDVFEVLTARTRVDLVGDMPLVRLRGRQLSRAYEPLKRLIDICGSVFLLLVTLPLWPWWILRIKLDSPGPVLFRQQRVGKDGIHFTLYKLRTMHASESADLVAPREANDPRITHYGAWLRRTSIDELPNLYNVLRGEMSLVGPRPEMPFIVETYQDWQRRRLRVKPGITGLWQILGRKDLPMHDNLQYDFYYIHNRSLFLDLSILLRTVIVVFTGKGAF